MIIRVITKIKRANLWARMFFELAYRKTVHGRLVKSNRNHIKHVSTLYYLDIYFILWYFKVVKYFHSLYNIKARIYDIDKNVLTIL